MPKFFIGTSGWNYPHWKGPFYPLELSQKKWLRFYAGFFNAVELNVTFYRLIKKETFSNWYEGTPEDFYFVVKGSRFITHMKKLAVVEESLGLFTGNACCLKEKLAALIWQLPEVFKKDLSRLEPFLKLLKKTGARQVFEFRHKSWFDKETYRLLNKYNACLCIADSASFPCVRKVTADFLYLRFHGPCSLYSSNYSERELREWAYFAKRKNIDVFAFFNNDSCGYAVNNAVKFRKLLSA